MKQKLYILLWVSCLFVFKASSQNASIVGVVKDTINFKPMAYSSIALIRFKDSILIKHIWLPESEEFTFTALVPDTYMLQITRPNFADYEEKIILRDGETKQLGTIRMISKSNLLREVIIKERGNAIRIKGDTTEFLVDSFLTNKNANVEDLLKKLPGIQVDKDGKIIAQGQEVKKVLVDGEEFFGEDPTVATRNLRADNVEKVQVFDKKSDQAAFSGIDDGVKEKTINLQLKEDAKKGYFGKVSAGGGTNTRYENDAMVNFFKNKRKISAYGAMSNTNKTSLSWDDANKFGGGNNNNYEMDESSGFMYSYYNGDNMDFDGVGVPQTWYAGAHFSDKINQDKHGYNLNITQKDLQSSGVDKNYTKYILPDTLYYLNQRKDVQNHKMQTSFSGTYEWKVDSFSTIKIKVSAKDGSSRSFVNTLSDNYNGNAALVNQNIRRNAYNNHNQSDNISLSWNRKFRTTGRSLMMQINQNYNFSSGEDIVQSTVNLFDVNGVVSSTSYFDQRKTTESKSNTINAKTTYTEPLSKYWFVVLDYDLSTTFSSSNRITKALKNGEYSLLIDSLTNNLKYDVYVNKGGLSLRYVKKKLNVSFGGKSSYTDMRQVEQSTLKTSTQYFFNLFPAVSFNYKIKTTSNFNFGYNGSTRQPSIQQLQPIKDNSNPLDIFQGNPDLKQSFSNRFNMFYNTYKPISGQSFYTSMSFSFTDNDFVSFDSVDEYGRRLHKTINANGNNSFWMWSSYYFSIKKLNLRFGTNVNANAYTNVNYINGLKNINKSQSVGFGENISFELEKKLEVYVNADWDYNHGTSTLRKDIVTKYWVQTYSVYLVKYLPKKFSVDVDCTFNIRQKTNDFSKNLNVTLFNAGVKKKFFKSEALVVGIYAYDLLNQNLGFDRSVNSNYVNEHTYSVLKNYFLFTVTWNFTKGPVEQDDE